MKLEGNVVVMEHNPAHLDQIAHQLGLMGFTVINKIATLRDALTIVPTLENVALITLNRNLTAEAVGRDSSGDSQRVLEQISQNSHLHQARKLGISSQDFVGVDHNLLKSVALQQPAEFKKAIIKL